MEDISRYAGLPLGIGADGLLHFGEGLPAVKPAVRTLAEVRDVLHDREATGPDELYYIYRGVHWPAHRRMLERRRLRFDVTVLRPGLVGKEYVKTAGHYHPRAPGASFTYPELYRVLHGQAYCLLQRPGMGDGEISEAVLVEASAGDTVFIPPGYGHVTINRGTIPLVLANWVEARFSSVYDEMQHRRGGCYHILAAGGGSCCVPNEAYSSVPSLRCFKAEDWSAPPLPREPFYMLGVDAPQTLAFLTEPRLLAAVVLPEGVQP